MAEKSSIKLVLVKKHTTLVDQDATKVLIACVQAALTSLTSKMNDIKKNRAFLSTLAIEIVKKIQATELKNYNAFIGEKFDTAIRYEKTSLLALKWDNVSILLFRSPANPIFSLEEDVVVDPQESESVNSL